MPIVLRESGITLKHPTGSTSEIFYYGATVLSWKVADDSGVLKERLFVSSKAFLDGSKPIRGGIPVVFPCFGAPTHPDHSKLTQHGFARSEMWKLNEVVKDDNTGVSVSFVLDPTGNERISSVYAKSFRLIYLVTLAAQQLSTEFHVENISYSDVLEFQALLHTYIRAPSDDIEVTPLQGLSYYDKTEATDEARALSKLETRAVVDVRKFTDSVYENAPLKYKVNWSGGSIEIIAKGFKDVVVWNPQETGSKIGDMEPNGWKNYVCVEPGYVRGFVHLEPKNTWIGEQVLIVRDDFE